MWVGSRKLPSQCRTRFEDLPISGSLTFVEPKGRRPPVYQDTVMNLSSRSLKMLAASLFVCGLTTLPSVGCGGREDVVIEQETPMTDAEMDEYEEASYGEMDDPNQN